MTEHELQSRFDLSPSAARAVADALAKVANKPRPIPPAERQRRIANLPNIAGSLRIEGLTLTPSDMRFHAYVQSLGLESADAKTLVRAYTLSTLSATAKAPVPAE